MAHSWADTSVAARLHRRAVGRGAARTTRNRTGPCLADHNMVPWFTCRLVVSTYPSEKDEFVSWDDDIPNMMGKS